MIYLIKHNKRQTLKLKAVIMVFIHKIMQLRNNYNVLELRIKMVLLIILIKKNIL